MAAEGNLKKQVDRLLQTLWKVDKFPLWYLKVAGGPFQRGGVPDYIIGLNGILIGLELKAPKGVLSKRQEYEISWLHQAGCRVLVADSYEAVAHFLYVQAVDALGKAGVRTPAAAGLDRLSSIKERPVRLG